MPKIVIPTTVSNIKSVSEFVRWFSNTMDQIISLINGRLDHSNIDCYQFKNVRLSELTSNDSFFTLTIYSYCNKLRHGLSKKPIAYLEPTIVYQNHDNTSRVIAILPQLWDDKYFYVWDSGHKNLNTVVSTILYG